MGVSSLDCGAVQSRHAYGGAAFSGREPSVNFAARDAKICELHALGCRASEIAAVYGIKQNRVWQIVKAHREARA